MPRPTPARLLYLIVGLVIGLIATVFAQSYFGPSLLASLPVIGGATAPAPAPASGPAQLTAGTLEKVQMINQTQEKGGVQLRLNTLELYKDGFALTYTLTSGRGAAPETIEPETFVVTDDRNTPYTLSTLGTSAAASAGFTAGLVSFTPAPPAELRTLRVTVPNALTLGLRPPPSQSRVIAGPWDFTIQLTR